MPRTRHRTVCAYRCAPVAKADWPLGRSDTRIQCGPNLLNLNNGVTSRRPAACAAWLEQTASLPCATQHTLRAFWTSCRVPGIDQSIPRHLFFLSYFCKVRSSVRRRNKACCLVSGRGCRAEQKPGAWPRHRKRRGLRSVRARALATKTAPLPAPLIASGLSRPHESVRALSRR